MTLLCFGKDYQVLLFIRVVVIVLPCLLCFFGAMGPSGGKHVGKVIHEKYHLPLWRFSQTGFLLLFLKSALGVTDFSGTYKFPTTSSLKSLNSADDISDIRQFHSSQATLCVEYEISGQNELF